jgi:hypothetical protein
VTYRWRSRLLFASPIHPAVFDLLLERLKLSR